MCLPNGRKQIALHLAAALTATRQKVPLNDLTRQALSEYLLQHA